jgi:hypothetical protein
MSNDHGVENLSQQYWVNGDTWTHGETSSPNQICKRNPQLDFPDIRPGMSASMSASVECKHEHIVIIDSLQDLHKHGGDIDSPTIVSNTTALGL